MRKFLAWGLLALVLVGGEALAGGPLEVADPANTIVLVYTHGSGPARKPDRCRLSQNSFPGTPRAISALDGQSRDGITVLLHRFCTPSRTGTPLSVLRGENLEKSKVMRRANDMVELAMAYRAAGVGAENIVLSGHSAGGFAALLAQMAAPEAIGKVIALAPAFASRRRHRNAGERIANDILKPEIAAAPGMDALVFVFEGDPYERPEDLAEWSESSGLRLVPLGREIDGERCRGSNAHRRSYDACFTVTQSERIADYVFGDAE